MDISKNLKDIRKFYRFKSSWVAEKLGITQQAYNRYEDGTRAPSIDTLEKLARVYTIPIQCFFADLNRLNKSGYNTCVEAVSIFDVLNNEFRQLYPEKYAPTTREQEKQDDEDRKRMEFIIPWMQELLNYIRNEMYQKDQQINEYIKRVTHK